jgi:hypothetical protein
MIGRRRRIQSDKKRSRSKPRSNPRSKPRSKSRRSKPRSKSRRSQKKGKDKRTRRKSRNLSKNTIGLGILGLMGLGLKRYYDRHFIIEVMPDVEGCWNKVISFISKSRIFTIGSNFGPENFKQIKMRSNSKFVCLGDTIDNGPNNLAILRFLKFLKEKYGNQVVFIIGNRDLNKIRLKFEIMNYKPRINLSRLVPGNNQPPVDYGTQTPVERLQWLLKNTFGAPNTFDFIKNEIKATDDNAVVDKYLEILEDIGHGDKGLLTYYLMNGKLIYYDKKTKSLFTHGGINCKNFEKSNAKSISDWVYILNNWYLDKLNRAYSIKNEEDIEELLLYQDERDYIKDDNKGAIYSVILSRPWKTPPISNPDIGLGTSIIEEGCFDKIAKDVKFIFVGHTPVGQMPVMMRVNKDNKEIIYIFCDTTFAGRVGNIKLVKGNVIIDAQYNKKQSLTPKDICTKVELSDLIDVTYSSEDPNIGLTKEDGLVIAKINGSYALGKWIGKPNANNPAFVEASEYIFKDMV